jgi:hypothetical protein
MRCSQLETRLNDVLDRRGDPWNEPDIAAHAGACRRCRRIVASYVAAVEGVEALTGRGPTVPALTGPAQAGPDRSVGGDVARRSPPSRPLSTAAFWAVAASLLLALTFFPQTGGPPYSDVGRPGSVAAVTSESAAGESPLEPQAPSPIERIPPIIELARTTSRMYVGLLDDTAWGVDGALALASAVPPADELLEPVLFTDDGLLKQIGREWLPAAGATLEALEQAVAGDTSARS